MNIKHLTKVQLTTSLLLTHSFLISSVSAETSVADNDIETIEITGLRSSVVKAMDIKRSSTRVVDAINAEDIGKFPDTNLAESLQRLSGVSIDRNNGEGQKVTVRGFSESRNLVTFNGRQLANTTGDRSFNFDNLAAESISTIEVFKTAEIKLPSGGLGATIDLQTQKPLVTGVSRASFSVKALNDTSTDKGSITPELSGIYSDISIDGKFGWSISMNYSERESGNQQAEVGTGWRTFDAIKNQDIASGHAVFGGVPYENQINRPDPASGDTYSVPQNTIYKFEEQQRKRLNSYLVLQHQLTERLDMTFDALYVEKEVDLQYNDVSTWYAFSPSENVWSDGPVASPLLYSEYYGKNSLRDMTMSASDSAIREETFMLGLNSKWQVNDRLKLEVDYHTSSSIEEPNSKYGSSNLLALMARIREGTATDFSRDLPVLAVLGAQNLSPELVEVSGSWFRNDNNDNELEQTQVTASYELDKLGSVDVGVMLIKSKNHRREAPQIQRNEWGGRGPGAFDSTLLPVSSIHHRFDVDGGYFDDFQQLPAGNWHIVDSFYAWDFQTIVPIAERLYGLEGNTICGTNFCPSEQYAAGTDRLVNEDIKAFYLQYNYFGEIADKRFDVHVGFRYEKTEVESTSAVQNYENYDSWGAEIEFFLTPIEGDFIYQTRTGSYSNTLPSINLNLELTDDVLLRAAYSETISRPQFSDLAGGVVVNAGHDQTGASGSSGNPALLPLESQNFDLSLEWYYSQGSYLAASFFAKRVTNAMFSESDPNLSPFSVNTPINGTRWNQALAAIGAADNIAMRQWIFDNYADGETVYIDDAGFIVIEGIEGDPQLSFNIAVPRNSSDKQKYTGIELTSQHIFSDTGFGVIANYTKVNTDNKFDNTKIGVLEVNPETGISDSANLIAFYESNGFQVRIAYNWRDQFLKSYWENTSNSTNNNPIYTEAYSQLDLSMSYDFSTVEGLTVYLEGINVTDEYSRTHGRAAQQVLNLVQTGARYSLGVRYSF